MNDYDAMTFTDTLWLVPIALLLWAAVAAPLVREHRLDRIRVRRARISERMPVGELRPGLVRTPSTRRVLTSDQLGIRQSDPLDLRQPSSSDAGLDRLPNDPVQHQEAHGHADEPTDHNKHRFSIHDGSVS